SVTVTVVRDGKLLDIKVELTEATTPSSEATNTPNPEYPNGGGDGTNSGGGGFFDPFWEWFYGRR
ncbi:MAG: hypothetical protein LBC43_03410, partial [Bifidobacteriaceae bacterium]|nr:hypothetical protein [Bifidobacteriaceae bacterium]